MNKTAIISGSSRGIGAAIAEELAKKGWNVVLNYVRNEQKAEELKNELSVYSAV
ncbi:MAG TPA: 3-oxoacyl-ACP reductase, partial [Clostridiales bacterium]|nr:3-oxoacyl-ACP reductase [Clostridiales bacterium]